MTKSELKNYALMMFVKNFFDERPELWANVEGMPKTRAARRWVAVRVRNHAKEALKETVVGKVIPVFGPISIRIGEGCHYVTDGVEEWEI